jgi:hypothetical protein
MSELINPFTGQVHELAKADNGQPSGGRYATGYVFAGPHGLVAGKKGHKARAGLREFGETLGGATAGGALGAATRNPQIASLASTAGGVAGSMHATHSNQRLGRYKDGPGTVRDKKETKAASMMTTPVTGVRSVKVMVPTGAHVSHANDLTIIRNKKKHYGPTQALEVYHGQGPMKSAVSPQHQGATPVRKASGLGQARMGTRGTPGSDIAQQARVGHRLDFSKAVPRIPGVGINGGSGLDTMKQSQRMLSPSMRKRGARGMIPTPSGHRAGFDRSRLTGIDRRLVH